MTSRPLPQASIASLEELIEGARAREPKATRAFILAVGPTILSAVRRVVGARHRDVEDIAQDAVIQLLGALAQFRAECSIRHFVCRVATKQALAARRHARYREVWTPATLPEHLDANAAVGDLAQDDELVLERKRFAIRKLLDELPEPQAEAVALYFIMGFTAEEIAQTTGAPVPTVRTRIRLAREALRERITADAALNDMLAEGLS